jgi:hypothetical protein
MDDVMLAALAQVYGSAYQANMAICLSESTSTKNARLASRDFLNLCEELKDEAQREAMFGAPGSGGKGGA